ncbi:MAG: hypothetical protein AABZ60_11430 [Planctomycetota bacterium]|mgnify:CR=1 FL=1
MARIEGILKKVKTLETVALAEVQKLLEEQRKDDEHFFKIKPFKVTMAQLTKLLHQWIERTGSEWPDTIGYLQNTTLKEKVVCFSVEVRTHWIAKVGEDQYIVWRSCGD